MIELIGTLLAIAFMGLVISRGISAINYTVEEHHLFIRIGKFGFRKLAISEIEDLEPGITVGGENWTNTLNRTRIKEEGVTIIKRGGMFKRLNITPINPAGFIGTIKKHPDYRGRQNNA